MKCPMGNIFNTYWNDWEGDVHSILRKYSYLSKSFLEMNECGIHLNLKTIKISNSQTQQTNNAQSQQ